MALITWSDKLSVGVKTIDDQHIILIDTVNELHAAMMKGQARAILGNLLCTLVVYTRNHFAAEEAMMETAKYPGLPVHRTQHRELTRQVEEYVDRFQKGDLTISSHLAHFLSDWLTRHIQDTDKQYGPCLIESGVS
jgi:hemerythrin